MDEMRVEFSYEEAKKIYWALFHAVHAAKSDYEETPVNEFSVKIREILKKTYNEALDSLEIVSEAMGNPYGTIGLEHIA